MRSAIFVILSLVKAGFIIYFMYVIFRTLFRRTSEEEKSSKSISTLKSFFMIVAILFGITISSMWPLS